MSHESIRVMIERAVSEIHDDIQYSYGVETDFNQALKKNFVMVNTAPINASMVFADNNVNTYTKTYDVEMGFYMFDNESSIDYHKILDRTDDLVDRFINKLNLNETIIISSITQTAFIKALADELTGHILSFSIQSNSDFDLCDDC